MSDIGGVTVAILLLIRTISHEITMWEGGGIHGVLETTVIPYNLLNDSLAMDNNLLNRWYDSKISMNRKKIHDDELISTKWNLVFWNGWYSIHLIQKGFTISHIGDIIYLHQITPRC